jgi:hypothetical protein
VSEIGHIRVLLAKEGDYWVAQCLEYDIGAQAADLEVLGKRLIAALEAEREESIRRHGKPFGGIAAAPAYFHERWEHRAGDFTPARPAKVPDGDCLDIEFGLAA